MFSRYKITLAYDGTSYCGWQVQRRGLSIQSLVQKALETALRHPISLTGSGRTDAGVHARGQTAHFDTPCTVVPHRLRLSLNALLPADIRILTIEKVSSEFHARYSAVRKIYHYHLHLDSVMEPFIRPYRYHLRTSFDRTRLEKAIPFLLGTHDFRAFSNTTAAQDSIRTLYRLDLVEQEGGLRLEFEGDGFLYKMVRNLTGILLDIAAKKREAEEIPSILSAKDRRLAGSCAPPQGLFLMCVVYDPSASGKKCASAEPNSASIHSCTLSL